MTSTTLKRRQPARRPIAKKRKPRVSVLDRVMGALPIGEAGLRRLAMVAVLGTGGAALLAAASWAGVPAMAGRALGETAARAGFRFDEVQAEGIRHMSLVDITAIVHEQGTDSLALIDLGEVRRRLLEYPWVADAQVARRLPNKIVVTVTERVPAAVWQDQGRLLLVDAAGIELDDRVDPRALPDLPLVIGPGANREEPAWQTLMGAAPALKRHVRAATWVGNRRWDLQFDSGETLKLPEEGAAAALGDFARRNATHPLLGRGWLSFDLRDPSKLVARKPDATRAVADPGQEG